MRLEPHRPRRYPFCASVELTDVNSETRINARTSDLSLFGCHIEKLKPFAPGTKIRIRIIHKGATFQALGRVVYAPSNAGMGVVFTSIQPNDLSVLENWLSELRGE